MLNVRPTGEQCDLHIRDRRAGQHTDMRLLSQMGQDEPLPVQVQHIGRAGGSKHKAAAPLARLEQQMHLRIVAQRLKMTDTNSRRSDRLFINNPARVKLHGRPKAFLNQPCQYFQLNLAHKLQVDLRRRFIPRYPKLRVFLLQQPHVLQHHMRVAAIRQPHPIGQHWFQRR